MMKAVKYFMMVGMLVFITACHSFTSSYNKLKDHDKEYQKSQAIPDLVVPREMQSSNLNDDYLVPTVNQADSRSLSLLPPNSLAEEVAQGKITEKQLDQRTAAINASASAVSQSDEKNQVLTINQNLDTAWEEVGKAMKVADYRIIEQDKNIATYFILDTEITDGKVRRDTPIYQVHLQAAENNTNVSLIDNDGKLLAPEVSARVLHDIHNALMGKGSSPFVKWLKKHLEM